MVTGLKEKGFREGNKRSLSRYSAESGLSTADAMIRDRTDGRYNPVITVRSQAVQAVANASEQDRATDVFGIDTDLAASGVRIGCTHRWSFQYVSNRNLSTPPCRFSSFQEWVLTFIALFTMNGGTI
jgi:hypothetical protein